MIPIVLQVHISNSQIYQIQIQIHTLFLMSYAFLSSVFFNFLITCSILYVYSYTTYFVISSANHKTFNLVFYLVTAFHCHSHLSTICGPTLQLRHNECDGITNHQCLHCLFNCWLRPRSKETSKLHVAGLCVGNSLVTIEFPTQKASYAENVSIWCMRHKP